MAATAQIPRALLTAVALLIGLVALSSAASRQDYCKLCASHTMCRFQGVAQTCRAGRWEHNVPANLRNTIVDVHNQMRNTVALGQEKRGRPGPQPPASNMQRMVWDNELAEIAQRWADQCNYQHDSCRKVGRFQVGQNLYIKMQWPCSSMDNKQQWEEAIRAWYNEAALHSKNAVGSYKGGSDVGHYTQLVWASTNRVGCGFALFQSGNQCKKYYVCNYGPAGNFINQPLYKVGKARSACSSSSGTDKRFPGLC